MLLCACASDKKCTVSVRKCTKNRLRVSPKYRERILYSTKKTVFLFNIKHTLNLSCIGCSTVLAVIAVIKRNRFLPIAIATHFPCMPFRRLSSVRLAHPALGCLNRLTGEYTYGVRLPGKREIWESNPQSKFAVAHVWFARWQYRSLSDYAFNYRITLVLVTIITPTG